MINFVSLGHICINVDNIDEATEFYKELFGAVPIQDFPNFKNKGFAKAAGFLNHPEKVEVTIRFIQLPTQGGIFLELMQYYVPVGKYVPNYKEAADRNLVAHIALRVTNIAESFEHIKTVKGVRLITDSVDYRPFKIDDISPSEFYFFDDKLENNEEEKKKVCSTIRNIRYFYFVDKYGVQWELEQGHDDIDSNS